MFDLTASVKQYNSSRFLIVHYYPVISFPGVAKALTAYGSAGAAAAAKDEDSDFGDDLFGDSDSEEDEETQKRLAEYKAKKSKSK